MILNDIIFFSFLLSSYRNFRLTVFDPTNMNISIPHKAARWNS